jgi:hypothetical protein
MTAARYIGRNGQGLLEVITRAKQFAVAYREPEQRKGRRRIYGKKVILKTLFEQNRNDVIRTELVLYGKRTMVQYLRVDLIQRPTRQRVRFVLTVIGNSQFAHVLKPCPCGDAIRARHNQDSHNSSKAARIRARRGKDKRLRTGGLPLYF